jgi:hypothetical protein
MTQADQLEELNIIKYIASQNGYKPEIIDRINLSYKNKIAYRNYTTLNLEEDTSKKYISMEYNSFTSSKVQKIFRNFGYTIAFKTQQNLEMQLKPKKEEILDTGVYQLICSDCPAFYIGQTGRSFGQRFKEHVRDIGKMYATSNFAIHINTTQHNYIDMNTNMKILYTMVKGDNMDRMEELLIYKNRRNNNLLNNKINTPVNKIYDIIIRNS